MNDRVDAYLTGGRIATDIDTLSPDDPVYQAIVNDPRVSSLSDNELVRTIGKGSHKRFIIPTIDDSGTNSNYMVVYNGKLYRWSKKEKKDVVGTDWTSYELTPVGGGEKVRITASDGGTYDIAAALGGNNADNE